MKILTTQEKELLLTALTETITESVIHNMMEQLEEVKKAHGIIDTGTEIAKISKVYENADTDLNCTIVSSLRGR